jgi:hypothetical protein
MHYSNLHAIEEDLRSFNKMKKYIVFVNDDAELRFKYDIEDETLYVPYYNIVYYLGEGVYDPKEFARWVYKNYGVRARKVSTYFENI